jgi:hypothetical protein
MVENVGAEIDELARIEDCAKRSLVNSPFVVTVDPSRVENDPDVREKDEIVNVELTVKVSTVMFALETEENRP